MRSNLVDMADGIAAADNLPAQPDGGAKLRLPVADAQCDEAAFDQLIAEHHDRIARLVHRLGAWSADTEDVVQDVFLTAWENLRKFKGQSSLSTWLSRIAVNRCRWHYRRRLVCLSSK